MKSAPLIECVPNFSEARNSDVIKHIVTALDSVPGASVWHVDANFSANRTVVTLAGAPDAVCEAAFLGYQAAATYIDMRRHNGVHPCFGAVDVCPFVPLQNAPIELCIALAQKLGQKTADAFGVPVFLYGAATPAHAKSRTLASLRKNGVRGITTRLKNASHPGTMAYPDYGPACAHKTLGATAIGARHVLIAYNINLDSKDVRLAQSIARTLRRDQKRFPCVLAKGWLMDTFDCTQVTMNLTDYTQTGLHTVYEETSRLAKDAGTRVTGSEIVGLVPKGALIAAGRFYEADVDESRTITAAIKHLGLNDVRRFSCAQQFIESYLTASP